MTERTPDEIAQVFLTLADAGKQLPDLKAELDKVALFVTEISGLTADVMMLAFQAIRIALTRPGDAAPGDALALIVALREITEASPHIFSKRDNNFFAGLELAVNKAGGTRH